MALNRHNWGCLPRRASEPLPLLQQGLFALVQILDLALLDVHEPVTEGSGDTGVEWVVPQRLLRKVRAHLDSELPPADGRACSPVSQCLRGRAGR